MLQAIIIGHLGADAEVKNSNGREFVTFRIANTDRWTDDAGTVHEQTTWVDCILSEKQKVADYLKKGQQVYVSGNISLRVYSSAKDKCMKAGLTINVRQVQLLGGKQDDVPAKLYSEDGTQEVQVVKYYNAPQLVRGIEEPETLVAVSRNQERFNVDRNGWIKKATTNEG